jgi:hypothetical protein
MSRRLKRAQALLRQRLIQRGFSLAIGFILLGIAGSAIWNTWRVHRAAGASLRSAMSSLAPLTDGETGLQSVIAQIDRPDANRGALRVTAFARRAIRVADEIEQYASAKRPEEWHKYATEMQRSAILLAQASQQNDRSSMLSAARRLNATCVGCHEAFR